MYIEGLPNPGSFNEFKAQVEEWGVEREDAWLMEKYTLVLSGLQAAIAERDGKSLAQLHYKEDLEFVA